MIEKNQKSINPLKMWGSWIGLLIVIIIFFPAIIGAIRANINSCIGSNMCSFDESCSNMYHYWDPDDYWFDFSKRRGGACGEFDFLCAETSHCEKLNCESGKYAHIRRNKESKRDKVTWHYCLETQKGMSSELTIYDFYCQNSNHDCLVYNSGGDIIQDLSTGNSEQVNIITRRSSNKLFVVFIVFISIFSFLSGWFINILIRKSKK
jgi:hypothetical protein